MHNNNTVKRQGPDFGCVFVLMFIHMFSLPRGLQLPGGRGHKQTEAVCEQPAAGVQPER